MDKPTEELLEFSKIRARLSGLAFSPQGRTVLGEQTFLTEPAALGGLLDRVEDFMRLLGEGEKMPPLDFADLNFLTELDKGRFLEGPEAACLGRFIRSAEGLAGFLKTGPARRDYRGLLVPAAEGLPPLGDLGEFIFSHLDESGAFLENHPVLRPLKRSLEQAAQDIRDLSYRRLREDQEIWQAEVPTLRNGRMVLALKASARGRVAGLVHEYSVRGATVFIEPFDLVEKNNRLIDLEDRLRREERKILGEIAERIRERLPDCRELERKVGEIDALYVRARYALNHGCCRPGILDRGFRLMAARHPLLGPGAVPIDLTLDRQTRTLIITGPNTGGKTVALKTAGLLVMMHQFGLPIPAGPDSALALASGVYGDIGDDQSIENSLSTFSGHVSRYAAIMALADDRSLVLLDELGGGTDPGEGAALAMALLDWFAEKNITVITTTHLGVMKNYGFTRPGARNASVAFDGESLKPAYRIVEGIPGESHALEIARAAGLPEAVIRRAGAYREKDQDQVSRIIEDLLESRRRADRQEEELQETRRTLEETRRRMDLRELKLRQREAEVRREDYGDLKRWVRESRRKLENLVSDLISRGEGGLSRDDTRRVRDFVQEISLKMEQEEGTAAEEPRLPEVSPAIPASPGAPSALEPGGEVRVRSSGALGVLIRRERDGKWQVAIGPLRISLEAADLEPRPPSPAPPAYRFISPEGGAPRAALELDLRGQRLEEALRRLEFQIDSCLLSGLTAFSVIHGLGEGVLRKGVRDYLAACPQVKSFDYAPANEGGFGKTRVTL